jgi:hypothetical protein
MEYNKVLEVLAPCGLSCQKCMAYASGDIQYHSEKLKELLGSFENYAKRFSKMWPIFGNYPQFKELLGHFVQANCTGCRDGGCKYPNCGVAGCYKAKNVDFCFQCKEFPCDKTNFDENLKTRWIRMNNRIKQIGVEEYYDETKDMPRYV